MWKYVVTLCLSYKEAKFIFQNCEDAVRFVETILATAVAPSEGDSDLYKPEVKITVEKAEEEQ